MPEPTLIAKGNVDCNLLPRMANRHGLIAGATGTGKTVTLQKMAEAFSRIGVPVFMADVKGDLSGMANAGGNNPKVQGRIEQLSLTDFEFGGCPVTFWDVYGNNGHPIRTTISEMGPVLLARLLDLNETQAGVLALAFKIADDSGLLLLDMKDLRAMLQYVADNAKQFTTEYGTVSATSVGAIQRGLLALEEQGGDKLFGEPAFDLRDMMRVENGHGVINVMAAETLMNAPKMYSTFLLWLLSELFETLPEAGDMDKPKMCFFFDEAHLLFTDAPAALLEKIEQVVRLIRSKGVGIYFISQNPLDIPDEVLGQLGNRVQHALRAFTPRDQKAVKSAAQTFRDNVNLDEIEAVTQLGVGEALVSFLDEKGIPGIVQRAFIVPPGSQIGPLTPQERGRVIDKSALFGKYEDAIDRESAYEILKKRSDEAQQQAAAQEQAEAQAKTEADEAKAEARASNASGGAGDVMGAFAKSAARAVGSNLGRQIIRGVLGSLFGGSSRRR